MKKLYVVLAMVCFSTFTFAQREAGNVTKMPNQQISINKIPTDTLLPGNSANATGFGLVGVLGGGGYLAGSNSYGDWAKAQQFIVTPSTGYIIEGAMYWVGAKEVVGSPNNVLFTIWNMDGVTGTTTSGTDDQNCPGTVLTSVSVSVDLVDTSLQLANAHIVTFTSPLTVTSDYAIGIDIQNTYDDTLGLVTTDDGDGGGFELAWEKWDNGKWYTLQGAGWGNGTFDADFMILPIVDAGSANINDNYFVFGMKMSTYPNPARNETTVAYELEKEASNVVINILNESGRLVRTIEQGSQAKGIHSLNVDLSNLSSGNYFCNLTANGKSLVKRIVIVK